MAKSKNSKNTVPSTPVTTQETTETQSVPEDVNQLDLAFENIHKMMSSWKNSFSELSAEVKSLQKDVTKKLKVVRKGGKKFNPNKPKRAPSGFAKPTKISNELCDFLQQTYGTEMARTEVTKHLTKYIKAHNLQDQNDKRTILPDTKLRKLLKLPKGEQVTYFNLQKWMKPHFASAKCQA